MVVAQLIFMFASAFITGGLIFALVKRRRGAGDYILFWPNPFGKRVKRYIRYGTMQGTAAELSRIILFAAITLFAIVGVLQP